MSKRITSPENEALSLIPKIYRVALDDSSLKDCLESIYSRLDVPLGWSLQLPLSGLPVRAESGGWEHEPGVLENWKENFADQDPAMKVAYRSAGRTLRSLDEVLTQGEHRAYRRSDFFHHYIKRVGYEGQQFCFFNFHENLPESSFFLMRPLDGDVLDARQLQLAQLLLPHVMAATNTWRELRDERAAVVRSVAALDLLNKGVVFLGGDGELLHVNRFAEQVFAANDGISTCRRRMKFAAKDTATQFDNLVKRCAKTSSGEVAGSAGVLAVPRVSGKRPYQVYIAPVLGHVHSDALDVPAESIVFISDPDERVDPPESTLRCLYQLTPSESRLAIALANDMSLTDAATHLGITSGTARVMLKRIFLKTGTNRQASLVRLLSCGPLAMCTGTRHNPIST